MTWPLSKKALFKWTKLKTFESSTRACARASPDSAQVPVVVNRGRNLDASRWLVRETSRCSLEFAHSLDELSAVFDYRIEKGLTFLFARGARVAVVTLRGDGNLIT